jgi:hypothetical protein
MARWRGGMALPGYMGGSLAVWCSEDYWPVISVTVRAPLGYIKLENDHLKQGTHRMAPGITCPMRDRLIQPPAVEAGFARSTRGGKGNAG